MSEAAPARTPERMFPFVKKAGILMPDRIKLLRSKSKLHFVLMTEDISPASREQVLKDFAHYPVVQHYTSADLEKFFGVREARAVGFAKSGLAQSIYAELKEFRVNQPVIKPKSPEAKDVRGLPKTSG